MSTPNPTHIIADSTIRMWMHSRKGRICGRIISEDDTWVHIQLAYDHALKWGSESNRGRIDNEGDIITVRKSFLTQIAAEGEKP